MRRSRRLRVVVTCLMPFVIATACSSKPSLTPQRQAQADLAACDAQIRKIVSDPARADKLVAFTDELNKLGWQSITSVKAYRDKVATLNSNYNATREEFEALLSEQDAVRETLLNKALALREQMAALTTDAQWEELSKARLRALEAALEALRSRPGAG